jgi:hypothetical protein
VLQGLRNEADARLVERSLRRFDTISLLDPQPLRQPNPGIMTSCCGKTTVAREQRGVERFRQ